MFTTELPEPLSGLNSLGPLLTALRFLGYTNFLSRQKKKMEIIWQVFVMVFLTISFIWAAYYSHLYMQSSGDVLNHSLLGFIFMFESVIHHVDVLFGMAVLSFKGHQLWNIIANFDEESSVAKMDEKSKTARNQHDFACNNVQVLQQHSNSAHSSYFPSRRLVGFVTALLLLHGLFVTVVSVKIHDAWFVPNALYSPVTRVVYFTCLSIMCYVSFTAITLFHFLYIIICRILQLKFRSFNARVESILKSEGEPDFQKLLVCHIQISNSVSIVDGCFKMYILINSVDGLLYICTSVNVLFSSIEENALFLKLMTLTLLIMIIAEQFFALLLASAVFEESRSSIPNLYSMLAKIPPVKGHVISLLNALISKVSIPTGITVGGMFIISRQSIASATIAAITYMTLINQFDSNAKTN